jgi:hypothetical protein
MMRAKLHAALRDGPWELLHHRENLNVVLECLGDVAEFVHVAMAQTTVDVHGTPDDAENKHDYRHGQAGADITKVVHGESMWQKQFLVIYAMWQYPGLQALLRKASPAGVCRSFFDELDGLVTSCLFGTPFPKIAKKGAKTVIERAACTPLETVQIVLKHLQMAYFHDVHSTP